MTATRRARTALLLSLAALLSPHAAHGQQGRPPLGTPKAFRLPPHRTLTLANGLQITLVHFGTVPKAVVSLQVFTGAIDEPSFAPGLAQLMADMFMQGSVIRSSEQLASEAADLGGTIDASAGAVAMTIGGEVLSDNVGRYLSLVADVVRRPRLDKEDFERVRHNAIRGLAITMQNAADQARKQFRLALFPDHPFGTPYSHESTLKSLQLGHLRNFFDQHIGASRAHLYISGVFDDAAVESATKRAFIDWTRGSATTPHPATPVARRQLDLVDRPDAPQSTLWIGLPVATPASPDFIPLQVTDALLGGTFGSRITRNLREDKGYTYSPYSVIWSHGGTAYWVETADVTTKDTGNSLKEIFDEIERLRAEPPPADELEGIKQNIAGLFVLRNSSRQGVVNQLEYVDEHGLGERYLTDYVGNVLAVRPADVQRMAASQLDPARMTITVVGDRKTVEAQVAPYRPAVIP